MVPDWPFAAGFWCGLWTGRCIVLHCARVLGIKGDGKVHWNKICGGVKDGPPRDGCLLDLA